MTIQIFENKSFHTYGNEFVNGQTKEFVQVLFTFCQVEYNGRGKSHLDEGERVILWKPDGNFQIHQDKNFNPVNYQSTGSETTVEVDEDAGVIRFVSTQSSPDETLIVDCYDIYALIQYDATDNADINISGTEKDMQLAIFNNPSLIEDGFETIEYEHDIGLGAVDIFGKDKNDTPVIIEIKRRKAQIKHIDQLKRYITWFNDNNDETARGILVAPEISNTAQTVLKKQEFEFVSLDPLSISDN